MTFVTDTLPFIYHILGRRNRIGRKALDVFDTVKRGREIIILPFTVLEEVMLLSEIGEFVFRCHSVTLSSRYDKQKISI